MFKEENGLISMRRVLAFFLVPAAVGLFIGGFFFVEKGSWYVFLPGIACLCGSLLLLFFTTWSDVAEITKLVRRV